MFVIVIMSDTHFEVTCDEADTAKLDAAASAASLTKQEFLQQVITKSVQQQTTEPE